MLCSFLVDCFEPAAFISEYWWLPTVKDDPLFFSPESPNICQAHRDFHYCCLPGILGDAVNISITLGNSTVDSLLVFLVQPSGLLANSNDGECRSGTGDNSQDWVLVVHGIEFIYYLRSHFRPSEEQRNGHRGACQREYGFLQLSRLFVAVGRLG